MAPTTESPTLSNIIQLTTNFNAAGEAYFSQDMRWIVFQAIPTGGAEGRYQMYVAPLKQNASGVTGIGLPMRISPLDSRNTCGFFSPDGTSILFASTAGKEDPAEPASGYQAQGRDYRWAYPKGMEIFRFDGWQGALAAAEPGTITDLARKPITNNEFYDAECAFSPDAKWIVFTSNRSGDLELWAMRADGTNPVQLTQTKGYDGGPFFSPDGKRLVYRSDRKGNDLLQIYTSDLVFDHDGNITGLRNEKQLTSDASVSWGPFWHPEGRHIIYANSGKDHRNYDLWMMRSDGTMKTRITFELGADILPTFSPDGQYLMWASKRNGQTTQVYLAKFVLPPKI